MAFFNDMDKRLSQIGQSALKKTKDMTESVRLSGAVREEEEKQAMWYKKIGELFYETYADQAEGDLKVLCSYITASKVQVVQYKEQLKTLKGTIQCPNCGAEIPDDSLFCNVCGYKIERVSQTNLNYSMQQNSGMRCVKCGAALEEGQLFCVSCGTKVEKQTETDVINAENAVHAEDAVPEAEERRCPNCGKEVGEEQYFCTECGTKIE